MADSKDLNAQRILYDTISASENLATLNNLAETTPSTRPDTTLQSNDIVPDPKGKPLILLAEDNELTAETMTDYLHFHGFHVNLARDGYEVIEQALSLKPQLIIMDIQMPGINGFEAMLRLRAEAATAKTPIIALTGLAMSGDQERCLAAGANAYFSKPFGLRQLINTIQTFLSS
jgi:CheY-like chemotaxis protein